MAKQTVTSVSISDDARDMINDNFTLVRLLQPITVLLLWV
jgi:hypothetical protein